MAEPLSFIRGIEFEAYSQYLTQSRIKLLWIPMGAWDKIAAEMPQSVRQTGPSTLLRCEILVTMATRRGDLDAAESEVAGFVDLAVGSREPQRIVPMAAAVLAWSTRVGDERTTATVLDALWAVVEGDAAWASFVTTSFARSSSLVGDVELLRAVERSLARYPMIPAARAAAASCAAFRLVAEGRPGEALEPFLLALAYESDRGAVYDAACCELDLATALERAGDAEAATAARARADAVLDPLGCVHAI
jgi:hypothetical protein